MRLSWSNFVSAFCEKPFVFAAAPQAKLNPDEVTPIDAMELEPRVLYSASPIDFGEPQDVIDPQIEFTSHDGVAETSSHFISEHGTTWDLSQNEAELRLGNSLTEFASDGNAEPSLSTSPQRIVFIDSNVADLEQLTADIGLDQENTVVHVLESGRDGIDQISQLLSKHTDISSVHVVSHGRQGQVELGDATLSLESLSAYAGQIANWSSSLNTDADILFYGCELGANASGLELIESLGELTGADIAASDDLTGHVSLGGDWEFEILVGEVTSELIFSLDVQQTWQGVLVAPDITLPTGAANYGIGDAAMRIDPAASLFDPDSADFDGGQLTVTISSNGTVNDSLGIDTSGSLNIQGGTNLQWKPSGVATTFGTISGGGASPLVIAFNASADDFYVEELLKAVTYENSSGTPSLLTRTVEFVMSDGDGDTSVPESVLINVFDPVPQLDLDADDSATTGTGFTTNYVDGIGGAYIADSDASIIDADSTDLIGLVARISTGYVAGDDELVYDTSLATSFGISGVWSAGPGRLSLSGTATVAEYEQVLRTIEFVDLSGNPDATNSRIIDVTITDESANASLVAQSEVFIQKQLGVWLTTSEGSGTGANGIGSWNNDEIIELSGPSLEFEPQAGNTNGLFSPILDLAATAAIDGLHFVSRDIEIGGANGTKQLEFGDILFTVEDGTFVGGVWIDPSDIGLYAAGTVSVLVDNLTVDSSHDVNSFTLVEQSTLVGDVTLQAGTFLFSRHSPGNQANKIFYFDPTGLGDGTTTGDLPVVFADGDDFGNFNDRFTGLDLVETTTIIGGTTLQSGWILASTDESTTGLGTGVGGLSVTEFDVFYLDFTTTTMGTGFSDASAGLFLEGSEVGLSEVLLTDPIEDINGFTLISTKGAPVYAVSSIVVPDQEISGTIYEDVDGDGAVLDDGELASGVSVFLYDDSGTTSGAIDGSDSLIFTTTTDASGNYSFTGLADGTYWVVVDSLTVAPTAGFNATFGQGDVWAEQTFGSIGSVSFDGSYAYTASNGEFYGGVDRETSDDASALTTAQHVTRVSLFGGNKEYIDSGFSFNAITHTSDSDDDLGNNRTKQGSFRQFILNSNAIDNTLHGVNTSQFAIGDSDSNHLYYQNDFVAGLTTISTTSLSDGSIGNFDPDYPYAQHSWFRFDLDNTLSELSVTDQIVIDGYTQSGASENNLAIGQNANLKIELTNSANDGKRGLTFDTGANGSTVRGLAINGFGGTGVMVEYDVHAVTIQGNFIGTDITGTIAISNDDGGIQLRSNDNVVGGSGVGDRNVISGNDDRGIALYTAGTITGNLLENNYVGVDASGMVKLANSTYGVQLWDDNGTRVIDNVISGNDQYGIFFRDGGNTHNAVIQGNMIGVGADGATLLGNGLAGIHILSDAGTNNLIGGTSLGEANVIGGNVGDGIVIEGASVTSTTVIGNFIGTNFAGDLLLNAGHGILISGSSGNVIGGVAAGEANTIANNGRSGVSISSGINNTIRGNKFYDNVVLGIDLDDDGLTNNDLLDFDSFSNNRQNFPVLTGAVVSGMDLTIDATINSNVFTNGIVVDFYWSNSGDASLHGEAEFYIGSVTVNTNISGDATISQTFSGAGVPPGAIVTATATSPSGSTSEFALNLTATTLNLPPVITSNGGGATANILVPENSVAVTTVTANDPELDSLNYSITGGNDSALFTINASGDLAFSGPKDFETFLDFDNDGVYEVQVTVDDGNFGTDIQDISVTISDLNESPVINNQLFSINENTADGTWVGAIAANDFDAGLNGNLTFNLTGGTGSTAFNVDSSGNITVADSAQLDYETNTSFTLNIQVTDGGTPALVDTATVTVSLNDLPDTFPPLLGANQLTLSEGDRVTITAADLSATDVNDPDPGLIFTVSSVFGGRFELSTVPGVSITTFTQAQVTAGDIVFVDDGDELPPSYNVSVSDGSNVDGPDPATITFTNVNDAPYGANDSYTIVKGTSLSADDLLANDGDVDNSILNTFLNSAPANGTVTVNANGSFVYLPGDSFTGTDSFTYTVNDGSLSSNPVTVFVNVIAPGIVTSVEDSEPDQEVADEDDEFDDIEVLVDIAPVTPEQLAEEPPPKPVPVAIIRVDKHGKVQFDQGSVYVAATTDRAQWSFESRTQNTIQEASASARRSFGLESDLMDRKGWFWQQLDQNTNNMESEARIPQVLLGATAAITSGLTVGYLVWIVKGGQIAAAVMANLPAWRLLIDPLPILNNLSDGEDDDQESLETIIQDGADDLETDQANPVSDSRLATEKELVTE